MHWPILCLKLTPVIFFRTQFFSFEFLLSRTLLRSIITCFAHCTHSRTAMRKLHLYCFHELYPLYISIIYIHYIYTWYTSYQNTRISASITLHSTPYYMFQWTNCCDSWEHTNVWCVSLPYRGSCFRYKHHSYVHSDHTLMSPFSVRDSLSLWWENLSSSSHVSVSMSLMYFVTVTDGLTFQPCLVSRFVRSLSHQWLEILKKLRETRLCFFPWNHSLILQMFFLTMFW